MITYENNIFRLTTANSSYWFRITEFGHPEHIYYGTKLEPNQSVEPLVLKRTAAIGSSVIYDSSDDTYCLDNLCLEWSGIGKGDYRNTPAEIKMPDGSFTADFVYSEHYIYDGTVGISTLPTAYGDKDDCMTLVVTLQDESNEVVLKLYYTVYESTDIITRRAKLTNMNENSLSARKLMSLSLDMPNKGFRFVTFDGGWIKEANMHEREISYGIYVNSSTTGSSSNRHNPGFILAANQANESHGEVYGFNLIYSGNHYGAVELSNHDLLRIQLGINPYCFEWELEKHQVFETPEAVMSYSNEGFSGLSKQFHSFVNEHIVRGDWKNQNRPILINNWEATFFRFNESKLLTLAKRAKRLGIELFVVDDGWFGKRDDDSASLGDYTVNKKKFRRGIKPFAEKIHRMGMLFGLWFEPEMISRNSNLFRTHPEYALTTPGKNPAVGRNQLVLDLCNPQLRDYIVEQVTSIIDDCGVDYVKWDYNRHISDAYSVTISNQGEFFHRYIMGVYDILGRIFLTRPHILLESCSSGGNRFDLGMLCYSPQIWTSDNTDPIERLKIQEGLSHLYPLSSMGAHVSESPHQQTLRRTPLATRFNVSIFGCLGYEMDLKYLTREERKEVKAQIDFYKRHRETLQYGRFSRSDSVKDNKVIWQCTNDSGKFGIVGFFQTQTTASEGFDRLYLQHLNESDRYIVKSNSQRLFLNQFGGLVKHIFPFTLAADGFILRNLNKYYSLASCMEEYEGYGDMLGQGILLNNQFMGSYYNDRTRLLGDFGSTIYTFNVIS
ncbi:MAG: alpha-galactosidase [Oscillospiraceae bacterium]|nr:alpha-galactosidase [Oscillospiraceae bacterium]